MWIRRLEFPSYNMARNKSVGVSKQSRVSKFLDKRVWLSLAPITQLYKKLPAELVGSSGCCRHLSPYPSTMLDYLCMLKINISFINFNILVLF